MASLGVRGVLVGDQPLGRRDEVVEHVLLVQLGAGLVPLLAILAAAAQVGHGEHAAHLHPHQVRHAERGRQRDVEPAVAEQIGRGLAVALQPLLVADEHRDLRAVLAGVKDLLGRVVVGLEADLRRAVDACSFRWPRRSDRWSAAR